MNSNRPISVKELFSADYYRIPIYQRNYAWEVAEVQQLIQDVADYAKRFATSDYYIGSLIVMRGDNFETIDGQQRLTTLYILLCALKNQTEYKSEFGWFKQERLDFENRTNSMRALGMIYSDITVSDMPYEKHILAIYNRAVSDMKKICEQTNVLFGSFVAYLLNHVKILRIEVPLGINKNHYFEAMNSRGVQLEQHEIVKASLMNELANSSQDMHLFERIWEASANMERYLQMNFSPDERRTIFGDNWEQYPCEDFELLSRSINASQIDAEKHSLMELMDAFEAGKGNEYIINKDNRGKDDTPDDQFYSVVNFSNFILHVLKILMPECDIALDDKKLSDTFEDILRQQTDKKQFVKSFAICLLKCRFLYDRFIVKRKNEQWSLKRLKTSLYKDSRKAYYVQTFGNQEVNSSKEEIIKLLSMFHVSAPTMIYKNWLHASLKFVYEHPFVSDVDYCNYLRELARAYMLDRYLVPQEQRVEFMDIIYTNSGKATNTLEFVDWSLLDQGVAVENFVFNFYDYLLWKEGDQDYDFTYRTSVEHFFPQHPSGREPMKTGPLNQFGNLCLISSSTNSSFSNHMPAAKLADFASNNSIYQQTLKLQMMFAKVRDNLSIGIPSEEAWGEKEIEQFEEEAITRLKDALQ